MRARADGISPLAAVATRADLPRLAWRGRQAFVSAESLNHRGCARGRLCAWHRRARPSRRGRRCRRRLGCRHRAAGAQSGSGSGRSRSRFTIRVPRWHPPVCCASRYRGCLGSRASPAARTAELRRLAVSPDRSAVRKPYAGTGRGSRSCAHYGRRGTSSPAAGFRWQHPDMRSTEFDADIGHGQAVCDWVCPTSTRAPLQPRSPLRRSRRAGARWWCMSGSHLRHRAPEPFYFLDRIAPRRSPSPATLAISVAHAVAI